MKGSYLFSTSSRFINSFVSIVQAASVAGSSLGSTGDFPTVSSFLRRPDALCST